MAEIIFVCSLDARIRNLCRQCFHSYSLEFYGDWRQFHTSIEKRVPGLILLDYNIIDFTGPQCLESLDHRIHHPPILLLSFENCSSFIPWLREAGIHEIIQLPCNKRMLMNKISSLMGPRAEGAWPATSAVKLSTPPELEQLLGNSMKMQELKRMIYHLAATDTPLLLMGESGTGKTLLAKIVHQLSPRMNKPFCSVNMTTIPVSLAESELFGTARGAYTDAVSREGYFSSAETGTLFLDEIGDLPVRIQPKLLHVLEEQVYCKVGSTKKLTCNMRFLFATNTNLLSLVERGLFRMDLYYRISILPVIIPPLRERKSDIPQLVHHFLHPYKKSLSVSGIQKLMDYHWPGNIRELKNCLVRASLLSGKETIPDTCISF